MFTQTHHFQFKGQPCLTFVYFQDFVWNRAQGPRDRVVPPEWVGLVVVSKITALAQLSARETAHQIQNMAQLLFSAMIFVTSTRQSQSLVANFNGHFPTNSTQHCQFVIANSRHTTAYFLYLTLFSLLRIRCSIRAGKIHKLFE